MSELRLRRNDPFEKVAHHREHHLEYEGRHWTIDYAVWRNSESGELRVYRIFGDVTTPLLAKALQAMAGAEGLRLALEFT